jgi:hypothetical protein
MWSFLTTRSLIDPLPGYVENKAAFAESSAGITCQRRREFCVHRLARTPVFELASF